MGHVSGVYYKYVPNTGECSSTIEQETIAGAIYYALNLVEGGDYLCNVYYFTMNHFGTWHGILYVGPGITTWGATTANAQSKGCYSEGCDGLISPYSCNSKDDGN
ncbi:hypothetical protein TPHA_0K00100 [Tetrapisispora phaffii CBS 4417]|uniref:Secreted protein CSS2 C-terminal domain-containing protein n=1 Tax=Tetrapisispora phaffii (strain ATCC 24235 / CBS 4417 / NBRC 1672 / NRRL Y-8282 / UCD 70-5) TaxID=1071381 RepID=G8BZ16_TETPH|nr:hypothetical protein TPHA_0K00100 [Tetrapisispora phaffii CBS 4417]CCE65144.1 hypothetical protein TPHA_0K00100 [Tetrapisispora phaffii CBS 4417]